MKRAHCTIKMTVDVDLPDDLLNETLLTEQQLIENVEAARSKFSIIDFRYVVVDEIDQLPEDAETEDAVTVATPVNDFYLYQQQTQATAVYPGQGTSLGLAYVMLGLCGETGEVAEHVKKSIRDDAGVLTADRVLKMKTEIGDVLWYLTRICEEIGVELADVAAENLSKLVDRKQRGVLHGSGSSR